MGDRMSRNDRRLRAIAAALAVAAVLACAVGSTSAGRLSVSTRNFKIVWANLELSTNFIVGTIRCPVTVEGSFHSATIRKVEGAPVANLFRVRAVCTSGRATLNQEVLPWTLVYERFFGTLPLVASINFKLLRVRALMDIGENFCGFTTTAENPAVVRANLGPSISSLAFEELRQIPLVNHPGGFLCGLASGIIRGAGTVTRQGEIESVSITLV